MRKKLTKDPGKLHDYLRVRPIPIVVRGKKFYLVDHHHLVRALYDVEHKSRGNDICVYVKVLANASTLEMTDDGKEVLDEVLLLASSAEARGLPGFRGSMS
jgi:hypothetical protein